MSQQQQALTRRQQITAHDVHHYDRTLKGALAALEKDETVIPKNRELFAPTSNFELLRVSAFPAKCATSIA